jgi:hypothetical protein
LPCWPQIHKPPNRLQQFVNRTAHNTVIAASDRGAARLDASNVRKRVTCRL